MIYTAGLDTSNYKTSAALFDGTHGENAGRLLDVPEGALGLRQSDALFHHVKRLPEIFSMLCDGKDRREISAVGASDRPRDVEGSYMPCFLAGASQGRVIASLLHVPFFAFSHQQGHLAAAAWSADRMDLLDGPFLAWHLSGGTTELLLAEPNGAARHAPASAVPQTLRPASSLTGPAGARPAVSRRAGARTPGGGI
jgi:N6-L-threonylcarbamoyladenine synthase